MKRRSAMPREIKFRAWDTVGKSMIDWHTITQTAFNYGDNQLTLMYRVMVKHYETIIPLQFTGLKDKNRTDIYEGDILKKTRIAKDGRPPKQKIVGATKRVIFHEGAFKLNSALASKKYHLNSAMIWYYGLEVIGNIYENKKEIEVK
jgi:uncharacterized phage protein (TIGR01671 family)